MKRLLLLVLFLFCSSTAFAQTHMYLAHWEWFMEDSNFSYWRAPGGNSTSSLDLRSLPQSAKSGGIPEGWGLFVYDSPQSILESISFGESLDHQITVSEKEVIQSIFNLIERPTSTTVLDLLWDLITTHSDPRGLTAVKPLMPNSEGNLELRINGFGLIRSEKFDINAHPHKDKVLAVIQNDYRRNRLEDLKAGRDHYKRVLDALSEKYKVPYRNFIPSDLPDEGKLPHATTITEDWDCADNISINCDLTWDETLDTDDDWRIVSNAIEDWTQVLDVSVNRAESNLSSDDHYAKFTTVAATAVSGTQQSRHGPVARKDSTTTMTFYYMFVRWGEENITLYTSITGTSTALDTQTFTPSIPDELEIRANASAIDGRVNGSIIVSDTNMDITGNVRTGFYSHDIGSQTTQAILDDFEAADLAAAARRILMVQ